MSNIGSGVRRVLSVSSSTHNCDDRRTPTLVVNECSSTMIFGSMLTEKEPELKSLFNAPT